MLHVGISWNIEGYEAAVIDESLRLVAPVARFRGGEVSELIAYLVGLTQPLVAVIDSTNGMLDGPLMSAGLLVCRADPWSLSDRPLLGSVQARELAAVAARTPAAVTPLDPAKGTLTGREDEVVALISANTAALSAARSSGDCLIHGVRDRTSIALTFDDGPFPPYTTQILDILERHEVRATFFCVGLNVSARADDIMRMREQGHAIGNHTWSHPFLPGMSRDEFAEQIHHTQRVIAEASGGMVSKLFRPPYGSLTPDVMRWLAEMELTIALWDVGSRDWARPDPDVITRTVLDQVEPGSIVTLHDGGGDRSGTVAALPGMIEGLRDRGFHFVPVDEIEPDRAAEVAQNAS